MTAESVLYIRSGAKAAEFLDGICQLFHAAFPGQVLSIYVLGSRALGTAIGTSDVDLVAIFRGGTGAARRPEVRAFVDALRQISPVMMDLAILDEAEVRRGVKPHLKLNRLLSGPDVVAESPLRPKEELLLLYAGSAAFFIRTVRGFPPKLRYPLAYPGPGEYHGYEVNGIPVAENRWDPGFSTLANLVVWLANFRLAAQTGVFSANKSLMVAAYRQRLPDDPWLPLIARLYETCRLRLEGRMPEAAADRALLAEGCAQMLALENDFLATCILNLERFLAVDNTDLQRQVAAFARMVETDTEPQASALAQLRRRLPAP